MKYVKIPEDVVICDPATGEPVRTISFKEWIRSTVLSDSYWGKSAQKVISAADLMRRVSIGDELWELNDAEYHDVKSVVEAPSNGYNVPVAVQVVGFIDAVLNCSSEK